MGRHLEHRHWIGRGLLRRRWRLMGCSLEERHRIGRGRPFNPSTAALRLLDVDHGDRRLKRRTVCKTIDRARQPYVGLKVPLPDATVLNLS